LLRLLTAAVGTQLPRTFATACPQLAKADAVALAFEKIPCLAGSPSSSALEQIQIDFTRSLHA
jgi:hypothetical protein